MLVWVPCNFFVFVAQYKRTFPVWEPCNLFCFQTACPKLLYTRQFEYHAISSSSKLPFCRDKRSCSFEYHVILPSSKPNSLFPVYFCAFEYHVIHTFPNRKSIGTSKKSGLNPCNFTSAKPTVQHSEHLFEFENHVISSSSKPLRGVWISLCPFEYHAISYTPKPNLCVARDTVVFEPYAISFFHWLTMPSLFERHAISSASKTIRRG